MIQTMSSRGTRISLVGALWLAVSATPSVARLLRSAELKFKMLGIPDTVITDAPCRQEVDEPSFEDPY
jgi:hypothetical protein